MYLLILLWLNLQDVYAYFTPTHGGCSVRDQLIVNFLESEYEDKYPGNKVTELVRIKFSDPSSVEKVNY